MLNWFCSCLYCFSSGNVQAVNKRHQLHKNDESYLFHLEQRLTKIIQEVAIPKSCLNILRTFS